MPNQSQSPSFHIESNKDKTKTVTKRIKYSVDDKKGSIKKEDTQQKFHFNKQKNGSKNGKESREHDSSYRDSFLFVRV